MSKWHPDIATIPGPRYRAIAEAIARDIEAGRLVPGDRLPTHRDLAYLLGVTVGTVTRAYAEAQRLGLLVGEVGRGSFIAQRAPADALYHAPPQRDGVVDMSLNYPPAEPLAEAALRDSLEALARRNDLGHLLPYGTFDGPEEPRQAVAAWLGRQHRFPVEADRLVLTSGGQHAISAAIAAVAEPGDVVLCGALTWTGIRAIAEMMRLQLRGLAMDGEGVLPEAFDVACRTLSPKALYLIPTLQNPTGTIMGEGRRAALAHIAERYNVSIVEDDIYGFLAPDAPAPIATRAPEQTLYLTSLSKSLAPGLRIGCLAAPRRFQPRIMAAVRATTWMVPPLMGEIAADWIASGVADSIAENRRQETARRQAIARAVLGPLAGSASPQAYHLWMKLPAPWRATDFVAEARQRGVLIAPTDVFAVGRRHEEEAVRICLGSPASAEAVRQGLEVLRELIPQAADTRYLAVV